MTEAVYMHIDHLTSQQRRLIIYNKNPYNNSFFGIL